jgi:hypothetical protein
VRITVVVGLEGGGGECVIVGASMID